MGARTEACRQLVRVALDALRAVRVVIDGNLGLDALCVLAPEVSAASEAAAVLERKVRFYAAKQDAEGAGPMDGGGVQRWTDDRGSFFQRDNRQRCLFSESELADKVGQASR